MNKHQNPKTRHYDSEFKMRVIQAVLKGGVGYVEAARMFNVTNESTIRQWVKHYKVNNRLTLSPDTYVDMTKSNHHEKSKEELIVKLEEAEKRLAAEKFKAEVLSTMIDVAESELNIDIRKKSGTKQSK